MLTFQIDKKLTDESQSLVIKILNETKLSSSLNHKQTQQLDAIQLKKNATESELPILNFLIEQELKYQKSKSLTTKQLEPNVFHVPQPQTITALKLLAGTGNLFFNEKRLIVDLYSPVEFFYIIQNFDNQAYKASAHLKIKDHDINIKDCDLIGPGEKVWFIKGLILKLIKTDVSWKDFSKAYFSNLTFSKEELKDLQEEYQLDETLPKVILSENSHVNSKYDPLPILILKDSKGAFADLWIDYGEGKKIDYHSPSLTVSDDAKSQSTKRIASTEKQWEKDLLETDYVRKVSDNANYYCPLDKIGKSLSFLLELGWKIFDAKGNQVINHTSNQLSIHKNNEYLVIKGKIKYEGYEADLTTLVGSFNRRENFVQLGKGVVGLLSGQSQTNIINVLSEGEIYQDEIKISSSRVGMLSDFIDNIELDLDPEIIELRNELKSFKEIQNVQVQNGFKGSLRPYQQEGVNWLFFLKKYHFNGILADDMGLGKTVQVLAYLSQLSKGNASLIVVPTTLLFNWKREIERFAPEKNVIIYHGTVRERDISLFHKYDIILTTYTTLRIDLPFFHKTVFQTIVLDESQTIKNSQTQIAQAVYSLKSDFKISLTGTPIENSLNELWSHFRFLMPDLLGTEQEFNSNLQASQADIRYLQNIKKKIKPFILRRKKEDVAKDLPECIEQVVWVDMHPEQKKIYEDFLSGFKGNLFKKVEVDGLSKHRMEVFEAILRLRQICCHPLLVSSQLEENQGHQSSKLEALLDDLETIIAEDRKAIVYSQFTSMLSLIGKALKERGWNYCYLDGSTVNREKVVDQFQDDKSIPIFLISLKAGGVGLNLTAADYVFLYDPWWNEAIEKQAIGRAHRIGRKDTVFAKRYIALESIEEKIMKLKEAKKNLIDNMIEGEERANLNLTDEDFKFLFS